MHSDIWDREDMVFDDRVGGTVYPPGWCVLGPTTGLSEESSGVHFEELRLEGIRDPDRIAFTLDGVAVVDMRGGAEIVVLPGAVALTEIPRHRDYMIRYNAGGYSLRFKRSGRFSVSLRFRAGVVQEKD